MGDKALIAAAKHGDKKAFDSIVDKYYNILFHMALGIVRSGWDAFDVCQETFIKAYSSLHTLKDPSSFRSWISRILVNNCNDHFRRNKMTVPIENIETEGFIEERTEEGIDVLKALSSLREETRVVLTLRYFQGLKIKEIASIMRCPEGTVKSRINYGLKELRGMLSAGDLTEVAK